MFANDNQVSTGYPRYPVVSMEKDGAELSGRNSAPFRMTLYFFYRKYHRIGHKPSRE